MTNTALNVFENELAELKQKTTPFAWSTTKQNLGYAFIALTLDQLSHDNLRQITKQIKDKLEDCNPDDSLEEWTTLQSDLAAVHHALGQRDPVDTVTNYNRAMDAYKSLLPTITRQESPAEWALLLHNIADVFQGLGEHSEGARSLERSVSAYDNALLVRTAKEAPLDWALTQNNVAVSMQHLGVLKQDAAILKEAINAYNNAHEMLNQSEHPMAWVINTGNLGTAQLILAEETKDIEIARQAVNNFRDIVEFLQNASNSQHLEFATQYQDKAQAVLEELGG